jgi:hypothetical protein
VLIPSSQQGFSSWALFYAASKFCEQISAVSKFLEQILAQSKFDFREQFFLTVSKFSSLRAICVYIEIVSCVHTWIASKMKGYSWFSVSKFDSPWANLLSKFLLTINLLIVSNFFADVSRKIVALADPVLSQADMKQEMVSPPAGAYIPSFTIYHVLPDLPAQTHPEPTPYCSRQ